MLRKGMFLADRYEIIEQIGTGGMSDVYKAKCHKLNRFVAIKVLKHEFSEDKTFVSKFRAEAQSAAGLAHPNIVNVYDVGDENGIHYIVMELVEGITLKRYIEKKGRIPYKEAVSIAIQVAKGMEAAHKHHIIHRDIKPQNIIISKEGKVKVTDFGIAKVASSSTITSSAMGSVHYISPEQARGGYSDERSDIYSFGITLFEMLTGTVPFDGDTTVAVAVQHIQDEIPAPSAYTDEIPLSIDKIVLKCTQKKTERRYQNADELISDLKKALVMPDEDFVKMPPMYSNAVNENEKKFGSGGEDEDSSDDDDLLDDDDEFDDDDDDDEFDDDEDSKDKKSGKAGKKNTSDDTAVVDIDDENNDKLEKIFKWIGIGIVAAIILVAIFGVVKLIGGGSSSKNTQTTATAETTTSADSNDKTKVPDLSNMTEDQAKAALNSAGLSYKASYDASSSVDSGKVISQGTKAGTSVAKNTVITVSISKGPDNVTVKDVTGKSEADANSILTSAGFTVSVQYPYSDTVDKGIVISQTPSGGSSASQGATVTINVSRGKETKMKTVPNVMNMTESDARQSLTNGGFVVATATGSNATATTGTVIAQDYPVGTQLAEGSTVTITLNTYQEPTTKPTQATTPTSASTSPSTSAAKTP